MPEPQNMLDAVVDVSHWQPPSGIDYSRARHEGGILGLIVKVSQGTQSVDPAAAEHIRLARAAGMMVGCYHFLTGENGEEQAQHFVTSVEHAVGGALAGFPGILLSLDWERNTGPGGQGSVQQAREFIAAMLHWEPGCHLILYGNPVLSLGYCRENPQELGTEILGRELWLPKYGPFPRPEQHPGWDKPTLWQHTDGRQGYDVHAVPGMGQVDRSIWFGDEAGLRAWWEPKDQVSAPSAANDNTPLGGLAALVKEAEEWFEKEVA